ncbi:MAG: hypothetical protein MJ252_12125 [archaeon]|nr:hypothetical protein [archaeon]
MKKKPNQKKVLDVNSKDKNKILKNKDIIKENRSIKNIKVPTNNSSIVIKKQSENDAFVFTFKPKINENSRRIFEKKSNNPLPKTKKNILKINFKSELQYSPYNLHKSSSIPNMYANNQRNNYSPLNLLNRKYKNKKTNSTNSSNNISPKFNTGNSSNHIKNINSRVTTNNSSSFSNSKKGFMKINNYKIVGDNKRYDNEFYKGEGINKKRSVSVPKLNLKRSGSKSPSSTIEVFESFNNKTQSHMRRSENERIMEKFRAQLKESEDCTFTPKISSLEIYDDTNTISREIPYINEYVNKMREIRKNQNTLNVDKSPSNRDYKKFIRIFVNEKCVINSNIPFDKKNIKKHRLRTNSCEKIIQNRKKFFTEDFMNNGS